MDFVRLGIFLGFGALAFPILRPASAADAVVPVASPPAVASAVVAASDSSPVVELPPMMVEESISAVPWSYVNVGGTEFLSRCSPGITRQFVEGWLTKMRLVRAVVPEEFLLRMDAPAVFVLYSQDIKQTVSAEIQRELQGSASGRGPGGETRVNIAPNMRLADADLQASIAYIDETLFDASGMSISPSHVRFLLKNRVPELPLWMVDGIERLWRSADFIQEPITLGPMVWINSIESDALASDPLRPRALLPAGELFASEAGRMAENHHPRRVETRECEQELFFRWALTSGGATRAAFWKLAARATEGPVSEGAFEGIFGFDFADLRDRLSDYLVRAVQKTERIDPGPLPPLPEFEIRRATPNEIARVRGEWERLAIGYVQRRLPQAREPYLAQARRTLRRAYDNGDRDPRLLATMGLCELDAGNAAAAKEFLVPATDAGVRRPRAYHELARLRFAELRRDAPEAKTFSFTELAPVLQPLQRALTLAPPLPEVYLLLAEAWARCETAPTAAEVAELETGGRLFASRLTVTLPIARALAQHGKKAEAAAVLEASARHAADESTRTQIDRARAEIAALRERPTGEER